MLGLPFKPFWKSSKAAVPTDPQTGEPLRRSDQLESTPPPGSPGIPYEVRYTVPIKYCPYCGKPINQ